MNTVHKLNESVYHIHESNGVYCTLVIGSKRALLIDTGYGCSDLMQTISSLTDKPVVVVNTHGHFDHVQMNCFFPSVFIHGGDLKLLRKSVNVFYKCAFFLLYGAKTAKGDGNRFLKTLSFASPELSLIKDGDAIDLGDTSISVIETPGHTKGSVCFLDEKNRFVYCGDTVSNHVWICLKESLSVSQYVKSLERLDSMLNDSYRIIASHGDIPLNRVVLQRLITCAKNVNVGKSTRYVNPFCKRSYLYCEGLEYLRERYNVRSFEEMIEKIDTIDKEVFSDAKFVSVVYRLDKL